MQAEASWAPFSAVLEDIRSALAHHGERFISLEAKVDLLVAALAPANVATGAPFGSVATAPANAAPAGTLTTNGAAALHADLFSHPGSMPALQPGMAGDTFDQQPQVQVRKLVVLPYWPRNSGADNSAEQHVTAAVVVALSQQMDAGFTLRICNPSKLSYVPIDFR